MREYVYEALANGAASVAVRVPRVVVPPLNRSVIVTVLLVVDVGVVKANGAVPLAVPLGVDATVLSHVAVAVFVPLAAEGADDHVQE